MYLGPGKGVPWRRLQMSVFVITDVELSKFGFHELNTLHGIFAHQEYYISIFEEVCVVPEELIVSFWFDTFR
jgi:hypothetical protein